MSKLVIEAPTRTLPSFPGRSEPTINRGFLIKGHNRFYLKYSERKGHVLYICAVCQNAYMYAKMAHDCCLIEKPVSMAVINSLEQLYSLPEPEVKPEHRPTPRTKQPGDGVKHPDRWGHWRRGKPGTRKQAFADYYRAFDQVDRAYQYGQIIELERLYPTEVTKVKKERNSLQRLAFAFHTGSWEAVRSVFMAALAEERQQTIKSVQQQAEAVSAENQRLLTIGNLDEIRQGVNELTRDLNKEAKQRRSRKRR